MVSSERPEEITSNTEKSEYENICGYMQYVSLLSDINDKWSLDLCILWLVL